MLGKFENIWTTDRNCIGIKENDLSYTLCKDLNIATEKYTFHLNTLNSDDYFKMEGNVDDTGVFSFLRDELIKYLEKGTEKYGYTINTLAGSNVRYKSKVDPSPSSGFTLIKNNGDMWVHPVKLISLLIKGKEKVKVADLEFVVLDGNGHPEAYGGPWRPPFYVYFGNMEKYKKDNSYEPVITDIEVSIEENKC